MILRALKSALLVIVACLSLLYLPVVFLAGLSGGWYLPRTVLSEPSPDGKFRIEVVKRTLFPPNEPLDPSIQVSVRLLRAADRAPLAGQTFELFEKGEIGQPQAVWRAGQVKVTGMHREDIVLPLAEAGEPTGVKQRVADAARRVAQAG